MQAITIPAPPAWLPAGFRQLPFALRQIRVRFTDAERQVYRKRLPILPSKWAERHRYVTSGPLEGGKWSNKLTPYLAGIVDASFFPSVQLIINCKAVQVGGTTAIETCLGYAMDRRPGPALVVYPDRDTARENNRDNLQPMIKASPRLRSYLTGVDDDIATLRIKLTTMLLYMGWSGSATSLGNKSVKYLVLDEIDKYTETPNKKEAASIDLAEKRTTAYRYDRKEWKNSTPTVESGPIWQALTTEAQVIFEYWGRCPDCGKMQLIRFGGKGQDGDLLPGGIRWPHGERDHLKIETESLAWYECEHCSSHWSDHQRDRAVRQGEWRARTLGPGHGLELFVYLRTYRPQKIGFHLPAWISPFVSLSKCAAAFVKGQKDNVALKDFLNNYAAEPWTTYRQVRKEDKIIALCDDRPPGVVPGHGQVAGLFVGVDTHGPGAGSGFFFVIRAYGWAKQWTADGQLIPCSQEKWLIRRGFVTSFEALEKVLIEDTYQDAEGNTYPALRVVQDAMGARTKEVYDFSRKYRGWLHPFKGERTMTQMWKFSQIDQYPGSNKPIPGGVQLLRGNVTMYKNSLSTDLEVAPGDPGCRWNHASVETLVAANHPSPSLGIDFDFASHLTSEYLDENGYWLCPEGKPNHYWDCEVYADIAADVSQVAMWDPPPPPDLHQDPDDDSYQTARPKNL